MAKEVNEVKSRSQLFHPPFPRCRFDSEGNWWTTRDATFDDKMRLLDWMAEDCQDSTDVLGFYVEGPVEPYLEQWDVESRSPLKYREGVWELFPSDRFSIVFGKLVAVKIDGESVMSLHAICPIAHMNGDINDGPSCESGSSVCGSLFGLTKVDGRDFTQCMYVSFTKGRNAMSSNAAVVEKREPLVKFYKNRSKGGNGAMATTTTATSDDEFLRACADELPVLLEHLVGDEEHTLLEVLPQICEIWAKLRGYKAETIFERRMLIAGEPTPEASMAWVNAPPVD